ncbi:MAG: hypothetical protein ACRDOI_12435 [Trebonia sp.]
MGRPTPMDHAAASRISAAAAGNPASPTAQSGFDERAVAAGNRNDPYDHDEDYDYDHDE